VSFLDMFEGSINLNHLPDHGSDGQDLENKYKKKSKVFIECSMYFELLTTTIVIITGFVRVLKNLEVMEFCFLAFQAWKVMEFCVELWKVMENLITIKKL